MDICADLDDTGDDDADDNDSGCLARDVTGHLPRPRKTLQDTVANLPQTSTLSSKVHHSAITLEMQPSNVKTRSIKDMMTTPPQTSTLSLEVHHSAIYNT